MDVSRGIGLLADGLTADNAVRREYPRYVRCREVRQHEEATQSGDARLRKIRRNRLALPFARGWNARKNTLRIEVRLRRARGRVEAGVQRARLMADRINDLTVRQTRHNGPKRVPILNLRREANLRRSAEFIWGHTLQAQ